MATTIFEIKTMDAVFRLDGVEFKIHDPNYVKKNALFNKGMELDANREKMDHKTYMDELRKNNMEMISLYLPDIPMEKLESLGSSYLMTLFNHLRDLSEQNFGAVVEKVEKKSEAQV